MVTFAELFLCAVNFGQSIKMTEKLKSQKSGCDAGLHRLPKRFEFLIKFGKTERR
jgi:hypothetical protein